jgi:hypothetical protein
MAHLGWPRQGRRLRSMARVDAMASLAEGWRRYGLRAKAGASRSTKARAPSRLAPPNWRIGRRLTVHIGRIGQIGRKPQRKACSVEQ